MTPRILRIGTRGSALARWQADWVADRLRTIHQHMEVQMVVIKTRGDQDRSSPLSEMGGVGVFTKEIQRALLEDAIDVAVHSLKDLPTSGPDELTLGAVPIRETPADALIAPRHGLLASLPTAARVGTGSLRRKAQLLNARSDLRVLPLRGNVETRLNQALDGTLDAVVLAEAGLKRLGLEMRVTERLTPPAFLPAVGQGALGIECRRLDRLTLDLLAPLDDPSTRRAVVAERRLLAELEGGCLIPLAAWAREEPQDILRLDAALFSLDGLRRLSCSISGPIASPPEEVGFACAQNLREQGAEELLRSIRQEKA